VKIWLIGLEIHIIFTDELSGGKFIIFKGKTCHVL